MATMMPSDIDQAYKGKYKVYFVDQPYQEKNAALIAGGKLVKYEHEADVKVFLELSSGHRINVPWVRLESGNNPAVHIGFGRRKAKAIVMLRKQLAEWANYPLVDE